MSGDDDITIQHSEVFMSGTGDVSAFRSLWRFGNLGGYNDRTGRLQKTLRTKGYEKNKCVYKGGTLK